MKKLILLLFGIILLSGCTNINNTEINKIIDEVQTSPVKAINQYRTGYKYFLPSNLNVLKYERFNEVISDENIKYYLYVDLISYYNKVDISFKANENSYYSKSINYDKNKGYVLIKQKNEKYLIEIIYNYAKIEVIVDKDHINMAITNSMIILSTIKYNNDVIKNMLEEDSLNYSEETFSLFDHDNGESNFLEVVEEYGTYEEDENDVPDYDLIKE